MVHQLTAEEIKIWRAETGLSQQGFAEMLGISRPTVARLEGGEISADPWLYYARAGWQAENGKNSSIVSQIEGIIRQIVRTEMSLIDNKTWYTFDIVSDDAEQEVVRFSREIRKIYDKKNRPEGCSAYRYTASDTKLQVLLSPEASKLASEIHSIKPLLKSINFSGPENFPGLHEMKIFI